MTNDELRALADAIVYRDPLAIARVSDYLRAQADAQPVAWRTFDGEGNYDYRAYELNEDYADEWNRRNPNHVGWVEPLYTHPALAVPVIQEHGPWLAGRDKQQAWKQQVWIESDDFTHDVRLYVNGDFAGGDQKFAYAQEIARRLNAAPAAPQAEPDDDDDVLVLGEPDILTPEDIRRLVPQAEPMADSDADYWLRNRRPILDAIERAGFMLMSNASGFWLHPRGTTDAQAEPKREPLSADEILDIATAAGLQISMYIDDVETRAAIKRLARAVERAAYERAVLECDPHEDDDRIDRQIKREIAERIRALGRK